MQITFNKGIVTSIGYRSASCETPLANTSASWCIEIHLRDEDVGWLITQEMEWAGLKHRSMNYEYTGHHLSIDVATETDRDGWLAWAIVFLRKAGLLDRDQELTAFAGLGLAYEL
jgi:hypothetical protein